MRLRHRYHPLNFAVLLIVFCLLRASLGAAEEASEAPATGTIKGVVTSIPMDSPIEGARVEVVGTNLSQETNKAGEFAFYGLPFNAYQLQVTALSHESSFLRAARISKRNPELIVEISMEGEDGFSAIEIFESREPLVNKSPQVSSHTLTKEEIKLTPGGLEDVTRTIATLPGVVAESQFTSLLYIRGGDAGETASYLDRAYLGSSSHFGGVFSIFNNELIEEVDFYAGGFPARYVNVLSGVLDVKYRDGSGDRFKGFADISMITSKLTLEGPLWNKDNTFIIGARRSYIDVLLRTAGYTDGEVLIPYYGDYYAKLHFKPNANNIVDISGLFSEDGAEIEEFSDETIPEEEGSPADFKNNLILTGVKWKFFPTSKIAWETEAFYNHQRLDASVEGSNPYVLDLEVDGIYGYTDFTYQAAKWSALSIGGIYSFLDYDILGLVDDRAARPGGANLQSVVQVYEKLLLTPEFRGQFGGAYIENEFTLPGYEMKILPGVRVDYWDFNEESAVSPRLAMTFPMPGDFYIKASGGRYYQFPDDPIETSEEYGNPALKSEKATHAILGVEGPILDRMKVRVEGWYKWYDDLIVNYDDTDAVANARNNGEPIFTNDGEGYAYGVDLFWQRRSDGKWDAYVSYGYSYTRRYNPLFINNTNWYYPRQDQRHTLSVVAKIYPWRHWRFSLKFQLHSGKPYTPINDWEAVEHPIVSTDDNPVYIWQPVYGNINDDNFPIYHSLDLRMEYRFSRWKADWAVYLEVFNSYAAQNVYSYTYEDGDVRRGIKPQREEISNLPLLPFLGFSVEF